MALPSGLEVIPIGTQGWNDIVTSNMQLLDTRLVNVMTASTILGTVAITDVTTTVTDPAAQTSASLSLATVSGTGDDTNINNNFSSIQTQFNAAVTEIGNLITVLTNTIDYGDDLKAKVNEIITELENMGVLQ